MTLEVDDICGDSAIAAMGAMVRGKSTAIDISQCTMFAPSSLGSDILRELVSCML